MADYTKFVQAISILLVMRGAPKSVHQIATLTRVSDSKVNEWLQVFEFVELSKKVMRIIGGEIIILWTLNFPQREDNQKIVPKKFSQHKVSMVRFIAHTVRKPTSAVVLAKELDVTIIRACHYLRILTNTKVVRLCSDSEKEELESRGGSLEGYVFASQLFVSEEKIVDSSRLIFCRSIIPRKQRRSDCFGIPRQILTKNWTAGEHLPSRPMSIFNLSE